MAEEEEENVPSKSKKEKDKDVTAETGGEAINPIEFKMFDKYNMQRSLQIPQKLVYSFQKELAGTLQKRLETIRLKHGADDAKQVAEKSEGLELTAGLQAWEEVDPVTGQLVDAHAAAAQSEKNLQAARSAQAPPGTAGLGKAPMAVTHITTSVLNTMRGNLPRAKMEDKSAMPAANRRFTATETKFEGISKADEGYEYGDYYETMEKLDREWKATIGKRPSELRHDKDKRQPEPPKAKDTKENVPQKRRVSLAAAMEKDPKLGMGHQGGVLKPWKSKLKAGPNVPSFLDGVVSHFTESVSPDCNLESWLAPINITPVFKIKDVPPEVENTVVTIARITHSKFIDDQGIAYQIRAALEKHHGYACRWHVIVGRRFGLQVNADKGNFLFMYIGHLGYVVFRTFG